MGEGDLSGAAWCTHAGQCQDGADRQTLLPLNFVSHSGPRLLLFLPTSPIHDHDSRAQRSRFDGHPHPLWPISSSKLASVTLVLNCLARGNFGAAAQPQPPPNPLTFSYPSIFIHRNRADMLAPGKSPSPLHAMPLSVADPEPARSMKRDRHRAKSTVHPHTAISPAVMRT